MSSAWKEFFSGFLGAVIGFSIAMVLHDLVPSPWNALIFISIIAVCVIVSGVNYIIYRQEKASE